MLAELRGHGPFTATVFLLLFAGCRGEPESVANGHVGRAVCTECHAPEAEAWTGSHHDLAMQEATEETVLGDFADVTFTHRGVTSRFFRDGTRYLVTTESRDGSMADFEVAYVFGVDPLQQYLIPFPGGRYQMLGIAWDARPADAGGQRWFHLYPDADTGSPLHWTRPSQNWNSTCAECHSTKLEKGFDVATRTFETTWAEIDVSCEACHGPGARHAAIARDDGSESGRSAPPPTGWGLAVDLSLEGRSWAVADGATTAALAQGGGRLEVETCAACHSRRAEIGSSAEGSNNLLDTHAVSLLREGLYHDDGQILGEVYVYGSFAQSKMYSAGVTCSDCHEPHSLELHAPGNALCTRCHVAASYDTPAHHFHEPSGEGGACVACHMPETTYMVVDPRRDHSLRVPRPDLSQAIGVPNACNGCHADESTAWAVASTTTWYGSRAPEDHYGAALHGSRSGDPSALPRLLALALDTAQPAIVRGTALSIVGFFPSASAAQALADGLGDPEPLVRLGAVQGLTALDPSMMASLAGRSLPGRFRRGSNPSRQASGDPTLPPRPTLPLRPATLDSLFAEFERVQMRNADRSDSWVALGDLYTGRQRFADARSAYETALELDSTDLAASLNLADLDRALGLDAAGEEVLFDALRYHADAPELFNTRSAC